MMTDTVCIDIQKTSQSRIAETQSGELVFGKDFSDHMYITDFDGSEWANLRIIPFDKLRLSPGTAALHYGQSIFEGMKAFRSDDGDALLFRPDDNIARLNRSAVRMCMPEIPHEVFREGLLQLIDLDREWIPDYDGSSLYIRPFMFATNEYIGVKASDTYTFMIITSPADKYYTEPVKVKIETEFVRACAGGAGSAKAAGNYGATLYPAKLAQQQGYHQLVWTDAVEHKYIEESGTMNIMFVIDDTLVTPNLTSTILAGVTRDSVLTIARDSGITVEERRISVDEIITAHSSGRLKEAFGVGTAAMIAYISLIGYNGEDHHLQPVEQWEVAPRLKKALGDIQRGRVEDTRGWTVTV